MTFLSHRPRTLPARDVRGRATRSPRTAFACLATATALASAHCGRSVGALPSHDAGPSLPLADATVQVAVDAAALASCTAAPTGLDVPMYHGDRARLGWNAQETALTPQAVAGGAFGLRWNSDIFDAMTDDAGTIAAHVYGAPLYLDSVTVMAGPYANTRLSLVFAATTSGYAYAVNAFDVTCGAVHVPAGAIVWRAALGTPIRVPLFDGDTTHGQMPLGVLGTPVIDRTMSPPRMYVVSIDAGVFRAYALDVGTGMVLPGWPVALDAPSVEPVNGNPPQTFGSSTILSQRGALNLSPAGDLLYVPFGGFGDNGAGFVLAVDTQKAQVVDAFAGANAATPLPAGAKWIGGMWSAGGVSLDAQGSVYSTVGNSPVSVLDVPGVWGQSILQWSPTLQLTGTYTPFNYHLMDIADTDLAGSSVIVLPDLDPAATATPHLIAFGGKQGNVYLLDRDHLPGTLVQRPPPDGGPSTDTSLDPPTPQDAYGGLTGPLNVFGPYSEVYGNLDHAKMRTTPAYFQAADGTVYLFATGATKAAVDSVQSVPPCVVRLRLVLAAGAPAYLVVDLTEPSLVFVNPGTPVVSSNGSQGPMVWMFDGNAQRVASLTDPARLTRFLYAVDGATMLPLWRSAPNELDVGGKYGAPTVAHGMVFVATDRIQAYGLAP